MILPKLVADLHQRFLTSWREQDESNSQFLEDKYAEIVTPRFRDIWHASLRSTVNLNSLITGTKEADSRFSWDDLLGLAYVDKADAVKSDHLLYVISGDDNMDLMLSLDSRQIFACRRISSRNPHWANSVMLL